jgi:3,4-dihydroxy 2-butanone 4-phosphate synthase/GTP cyclohydrolase II
MKKIQRFADTEIATDYGDFYIRVYAEAFGKETVVLSTQSLHTDLPVLVRIHSECMTGDTFKSKHCDCGKQLAIALRMIRKKGGVLIYLRQEGRGIGLYEKMRTYQLQRKGADTYDANVLLGHKPDARTYEMAIRALKDLGISRIRLLTNNPAKISELKKKGIEVTERIPLVVPANKYNRRYIKTKKEKFKHLFKA